MVARAILLLHEAAHATGRYTHRQDWVDDGYYQEKIDPTELNAKIAKACLEPAMEILRQRYLKK